MRDHSYQISTDFLKRVFGDTHQNVELRACPNERGGEAPSVFSRDETVLQSFCRRKDDIGYGMYFGTCTRRIGVSSGKAENVVECPALWVDIDCAKQGLAGDETIKALEYLPFPPTIIINSGGGLHAYWMLEDAIDVSPASDARHAVTGALRRLALILAGDTSCAEVARIMRLPGTHNTKPATLALYDGQPALCEILSDTGAVHDFDALVEWLAEQRVILHGKVEEAKPINEADPFVAYAREAGFNPAIDIDDELAAMSHGASGTRSIHATQLRVSASMIARGYDDDEIVDRILAATEAAAPGTESWNWGREEKTIRAMIRTGRDKGYAVKKEAPAKSQAPIAQSHGNTALAVVHDMAEEKAKRQPKAKADSGDKVDEIVLLGGAALAVWQERYGPIQNTNGFTYTYRDGIWIEWSNVHDQILRIMLQEACEKLKISPKPSLLNAAQLYFLNRPDMFVDAVQFDQANLIVAGDGVLDLDTMEVGPHSPSHQASYKIAAKLHGDRGCPTFLNFLRGAFSDQPADQIDDIIRNIQEWLGTTLVRKKPRGLMKGMLVWGASRTGKTQLSEILRGILGAEHTVATSVGDLGTDFGLQSLASARAWVADDAVGQGETLDAERYKKLITGELIGVRRKNAIDLQVRFGRPVMLTMNNLPKIRDGSMAVYNRSMMVKMTVVRSEDAPEPAGYHSIAAKIIAEELTGVLWWAIEGWRVASARGRFAEPECMLEAVRSLQRSNDAVRAWADEGCAEDPGHKVAKTDLFAAFCGWYFLENGGGKNPWSQNGFIKALKNVCPTVGEQNAAVRYITGIKLSDEGVQHWITDQERDLNRVATKTTDAIFLNQNFSASHSQRLKSTEAEDRKPRF